MTYLTEDMILQIGSTQKYSYTNFLVNENDLRVNNRKIFLSHSHKDRTLVEQLIIILAINADIEIYVDWNDKDMPRITSGETANKIRTRIEEMKFFLILATKYGLDSKWVPWETGIADRKPNDHIAIIPVEQSNWKFPGNEYFQLYHLYQKIEVGDNGRLQVIKFSQPDVTEKQQIISFDKWIKNSIWD